MKIILSTRNPSKAEQIKAMFDDKSVDVLTLSEVGIEGEAVEDGTTLEENALKKAVYAFEKLEEKCWVMSDDTGMFVHALGGEPGVQSAYWAGKEATTSEMITHCLKKLEGIKDRRATFETVALLVSPKGERYYFNGKVDGILLDYQKAEPQKKMPYSALFIPNGSDKVWAEMSVEEENATSHRGIAFRKLVDFLNKNVNVKI